MSARRWFKAILLLPINVLIIIPAIILLIGGFGLAVTDNTIFLALGLTALGLGMMLALWTTILFQVRGQGTAAPWDPPTRLVVSGPYRHVRNPMITSVFLILAAEVLIFTSLPILIWACVFFVINMVYLPLVEEKKLEQRFGHDYKLYKSNVPRWIPRWIPWDLPK